MTHQPIEDPAGAPVDLLKRARECQDAGRFAEAASLFDQHVAVGANDQDAWYARWQQSRCLRNIGDHAGFVSVALAAFNARPQRAEPLYDLARFYREQGMYAASTAFSEQGMEIAWPTADEKYVEDYIYAYGMKEEFAITANYARDPIRKDRGYSVCNWLALSRNISPWARHLANTNLGFYCRPAGALMPSFTAHPIALGVFNGCRLLNPSVARLGEEIFLLQGLVRAANEATDDSVGPNRYFLLRMSSDLDVLTCEEVMPPSATLKSSSAAMLDFPEARLFAWQGTLWCSSALYETTPELQTGQLLARLEYGATSTWRFEDVRIMKPDCLGQDEKSWAPQVTSSGLCFVRNYDPVFVVNEWAATVVNLKSPVVAENFDGGSQAVAFDGGWLILVRDSRERRGKGRFHRFVWLDIAGRLRQITRPFFLHNNGVEASAGLAWHTDVSRLIISYGAADGEAWIATVEPDDVRRILDDAEQLPTGVPTAAVYVKGRATPLRISAPLPPIEPTKRQVGPRQSSWRGELTRPQEIHVAMNGGLGDVLMCTPALRALRREDPDLKILFYSHYPEVVAGLPYVDQAAALSAAPADTTYVGYGVTVPPYSHISQVIGNTLGVRVHDHDVRPDCIIRTELVQRFQEAWRDLPRPHILVSRRASSWTPNKDWPDAHWAELIGRLSIASGVIETGWQRDVATAGAGPNYANLVGSTTLIELIAAIAAADIHIGPMSAPVHIAAAAHKPSVVIYGGYEHPRSTLYPGNMTFYSPLTCAPCWLRDPCPYDRKCLDLISPVIVERAVWDTWSNMTGQRGIAHENPAMHAPGSP